MPSPHPSHIGGGGEGGVFPLERGEGGYGGENVDGKARVAMGARG